MATPQVFTNAEIYFGGAELTGQFNQVSLDFNAESLDETVFGLATRKKKGGLRVATATGRGFFEAAAGSIDRILYDGVGADEVFTVFPEGITEGSTSTGAGFSFKVTQSRLDLGGAVGEILPFSFEAQGRGIL